MISFFGEPSTPKELEDKRNRYNLMMAGLLGVSAILLGWTLYSRKG